MKDVKVNLILKPGYQKRYTEACLKVLRKREEKEREERRRESETKTA